MPVIVPKADWDRAPWNRWSFQHIREILPTAEVWRGQAQVWSLPRKLRDMDSLACGQAGESAGTIEEWLGNSFTDGFIVLHQGCIVFERYLNGMSERSLHLSQSVSKSIVSSVAGILIGRGMLDPSEQVIRYLPELESTGWKGATLRQVMDMTTGVRFVEDYAAPDSDIAMTDIAAGWKPARDNLNAPDCVWDQILTLNQTTRPHGETFQYRSIETDVLAHCMERVTGTRLPELLSRELWQPLGCEESACYTVDAAGYALADGGFNATLRDYARFGLMHLQHGFGNGRQIIPAEWIDDITSPDVTPFGEPYTAATPAGAYRNHFWILDVARNVYMARGIFGQLIYIDPQNSMVVVKLSSWPEFSSVPRLKKTLGAIQCIADYLNAE